MDKLTYLAELAEGLARWVPERERQDILRYYAEYFDEAGPDKEGQVVAELGDPWALACRLAVEGGYVTQEKADSWTPPKKKRWPWVLIATVACVAIVAVSVARTAAQFGGWIGRLVSGNQVAIVDEVQEGSGFVTIPKDPGVEYIDGVEYADGFWNKADGCLDAFYAIDAEISLGNLTITSGEDYTLAIQRNGNLPGYSIQWELQGDTLKIWDTRTAGYVTINNKGPDVIITVPEGQVLQSVSAKTDCGNVFLSELDAEVQVTAKTDMGNVEGYNLRTRGKLTLKTDMGNVTLGMDELYDSADIELDTSMGNVEAVLDCYERDCAYELKTDMGKVKINGESRGTKAERKESALYKLDAESSMGSVSVSFRDDRW